MTRLPRVRNESVLRVVARARMMEMEMVRRIRSRNAIGLLVRSVLSARPVGRANKHEASLANRDQKGVLYSICIEIVFSVSIMPNIPKAL